MLINRSFNIGSHIIIICSTNMNLGVLQCKNCWKWKHTTFACHIYGSKCLKCNGSHKLEHHHDIVWYCKANFKLNLLRLKTLKSEPYIHTFKCINYKDEHQSDSYNCSFWKYQFNCNWHNKKSQELQEVRVKSICSSIGEMSSWFNILFI